MIKIGDLAKLSGVTIKAIRFYEKIKNKDYLILEWKSGDYIFGGYIHGSYVFEKIS